jgi:serine/threonine protein phosphatase PrpC
LFLPRLTLTLAFGDAFFKLKNTDYTQYVFGHPIMTGKGKMSMHETHKHIYPHIISPPYLIPTPVLSTYTVTDSDLFLVLASDGVDTPGVSHEWIVETVWKGLRQGQENIAQFLLDQVREVGRPGDDVSVVILVFGDQKRPAE